MSENAFDALAGSYDASFSESQIGRYLRGRVQARLMQHVTAGQHLLELGCGTGVDAAFLGQQGLHITALDASPAMCRVASEKTAHLSSVQVMQGDLAALADIAIPAETAFDGAFSNFGPLNCLTDWRPLAEWLAPRIRAGGIAGFAIMGPLCLWEAAWHGLHGNLNVLTRRLRHTSFRPTPKSAPIQVRYPSVRRISRDFAPWFRRIHLEALGLWLPPSDMYGMIEKRPRLHQRLLALEEGSKGISQLAMFADHYWIEFERLAD